MDDNKRQELMNSIERIHQENAVSGTENNSAMTQPVSQKKPVDKRRLISSLVSILCIFIGVTIVIINNISRPQVFQKFEMQITLTDDFEESTSAIGYNVVYTSVDLMVAANRETFEELEIISFTGTTVQEYLELIMDVNNKTGLVLTDANNQAKYFEYTATVSGDEYYYKVYGFKSSSAFWTVQFICKSSEKLDLTADIVKYASSVKMDAAVQ